VLGTSLSTFADRVKGMARTLVDERTPTIARAFRAARDTLQSRMATAVDTGLGFTLFRDQGVPGSSEVALISRCITEVTPCHFIDVGANVGFFSCLAASLGASVIAVEPHPLNLRTLYKNLLLNNFSQVEIYPIALSDTCGVSNLFGGGQGASLLSGWGRIRSNYTTPIAVNTLDNILIGRFEGERLVIKVDTEGNEFRVLGGARNTLARKPSPIWFVEIGLGENFGDSINQHFAAIFELFWLNGYEALSVEADRAVLPADVSRWISNRRRDFGHINFLFRRRD
jgi:FkbM family methyltransferase